MEVSKTEREMSNNAELFSYWRVGVKNGQADHTTWSQSIFTLNCCFCSTDFPSEVVISHLYVHVP